MDSTQFIWWLKGFLANKEKLSQEDLNLIKSETEKVYEWKIPTIQPLPYYQPSQPPQPLPGIIEPYQQPWNPITNPGWTCDSGSLAQVENNQFDWFMS